MPFIKLYSSVIAPFVEKYKEAMNDKGRKTVVNDTVDVIKNTKNLLEEGDKLPKDLQTVHI